MTPRTYRSGIIGLSECLARHPWPENCHIQGGNSGIVLEEGSLAEAIETPAKAAAIVFGVFGAPVSAKHYRTAFFEAFPRQPDTFIRGEGKTVEEAEDEAWAKYQRTLGCALHEFERRSYRTGAGICRKCGLFSTTAFDTTLDPCVVCGRSDNGASYGTDRRGRWHCEKCYRQIPEDDKSLFRKMADRMAADRKAAEVKPR